MTKDHKIIITIAKGFAEAMLSNPVTMDPHMGNKPDHDEIISRSIRMAEQIIKETAERVTVY